MSEVFINLNTFEVILGGVGGEAKLLEEWDFKKLESC